MIKSRRTIWSNLPGGLPCRVPTPQSSNSNSSSAPTSNPWSAPAPPRRPLPCAVASYSALPLPTTPLTTTSPPSSTAIATPSAAGANASSPRALKACKTHLAPADPGAFPPEERLSVIVLASSKTAEHNSPNSSWSLDELARTLVHQHANEERFLRHLEELPQRARHDYLRELGLQFNLPLSGEGHVRPLSRSTIQRILTRADLKPHKSVYWLNSHDPDFDAKARAICRLYLDAPRLLREEGRLVLS